MSERYFSISIPEGLVKEPILHSLVKKFGVSPNIFRAEVRSDYGWIAFSLAGDDKAIDSAIDELSLRGAITKEGGRELMDIEEPPGLSSIRVRIKVPKDEVSKPFLSDLIKNHDIVVNIRQARIDQDKGVIEMEITGLLESIDKAVEFAKNRGVSIDPIEGNVIE